MVVGGKEGSPLEWRKLPQKFHARADAGHILSAGTPVPALTGPAKYLKIIYSPAKKDHLLHFTTLQAVFFCLYGKALCLTRQVEELV